jgi:hypothetical protein
LTKRIDFATKSRFTHHLFSSRGTGRSFEICCPTFLPDWPACNGKFAAYWC